MLVYHLHNTRKESKKPPKKLKKQEIHNIFNQNELDKAYFQHDMVYGDFKDLNVSNKTLRDKAFNIAKIPKYDGYQRGRA